MGFRGLLENAIISLVAWYDKSEYDLGSNGNSYVKGPRQYRQIFCLCVRHFGAYLPSFWMVVINRHHVPHHHPFAPKTGGWMYWRFPTYGCGTNEGGKDAEDQGTQHLGSLISGRVTSRGLMFEASPEDNCDWG